MARPRRCSSSVIREGRAYTESRRASASSTAAATSGTRWTSAPSTRRSSSRTSASTRRKSSRNPSRARDREELAVGHRVLGFAIAAAAFAGSTSICGFSSEERRRAAAAAGREPRRESEHRARRQDRGAEGDAAHHAPARRTRDRPARRHLHARVLIRGCNSAPSRRSAATASSLGSMLPPTCSNAARLGSTRCTTASRGLPIRASSAVSTRPLARGCP